MIIFVFKIIQYIFSSWRFRFGGKSSTIWPFLRQTIKLFSVGPVGSVGWPWLIGQGVTKKLEFGSYPKTSICLNSGNSLSKCPYLGNIFFTFFFQSTYSDGHSVSTQFGKKQQKDPIFPNPEPYSQKPFKRQHHLRTLHTFSKTFPKNFLSLQKGSTAVCSP